MKGQVYLYKGSIFPGNNLIVGYLITTLGR
jgi:hypothetical protein